ncbi:SMP-30/gluconolactonase/LRE family protein [soil metagenome]
MIERRSALRRLATGFAFTEGPAWDSTGQALVFSDIPNGITWRFAAGQLTADRRDNGNGNGNAFAPDGGLLTCEKTARRVTHTRDGRVTVVCDRFDGKRLNSPNDVIVTAAGVVYFTDPRFGPDADLEQPYKGVYRVTPDGDVRRIIESMEKPNGLVIKRDGRLYVDDSEHAHVRCFALDARGLPCDEGPVFATAKGLVDGMTEDDAGNLYVACDGVWVFDERGNHLDTIAVPETPSNCIFGGADRRTLFITAQTSVYAIDLARAGS